MKQKLFILLISNLLTINVLAGGGGVGIQTVWDPWNIAQTTISAQNSIQQLVTSQQQLKMDLSNFKNYDGNATQWSNVQPLLEKLAKTTSQGNALSYSMQNLDQVFKQKYPGYQVQQNYSLSYQNWSSTTMDTLKNTLTTAGMQANTFATEQGTLEQLKNLSTSAEGRMQAAQVGNMIAAEQVGQTQKLRQLIISQTNAQNAYMAQQVQQQQAQQAGEDDLFNKPLTYPKYGTGGGFGPNATPSLHH